MEHNYEEIVLKWYNRLKPEFFRRLTEKYSGFTLSDAENIYQDAFIAVQKNILEGRVRENTSWSNYILTIGMNLASHEWRHVGKSDYFDRATTEADDCTVSPMRLKVEKKLRELDELDNGYDITRDPEAQAVLGDELGHTPEPCFTIVKLYYYTGLSTGEIADRMGYKNSRTVISRKNQCMKDLKKRVRRILTFTGVI